ncbi:MAG: hypothetical protein AB7O68_10180 [Pirellulales bacterium]
MSDLEYIQISLGDVDYSRLETDEDYREVAWEKMPEALRQIGKALGEKAWDAMQNAFRSGPLKMNRSSNDRRTFVDNIAQEYCQDNLGNKQIEEYLIEQLRLNKAKIDAGESLP